MYMQTEVQKINQRVKLFSKKKYAKCKPKKPLVGQVNGKAKFFFF